MYDLLAGFYKLQQVDACLIQSHVCMVHVYRTGMVLRILFGTTNYPFFLFCTSNSCRTTYSLRLNVALVSSQI